MIVAQREAKIIFGVWVVGHPGFNRSAPTGTNGGRTFLGRQILASTHNALSSSSFRSDSFRCVPITSPATVAGVAVRLGLKRFLTVAASFLNRFTVRPHLLLVETVVLPRSEALEVLDGIVPRVSIKVVDVVTLRDLPISAFPNNAVDFTFTFNLVSALKMP